MTVPDDPPRPGAEHEERHEHGTSPELELVDLTVAPAEPHEHSFEHFYRLHRTSTLRPSATRSCTQGSPRST